MSQIELSFENRVEVLDSSFPSRPVPKLKETSCRIISIVSPTYNESENIRLLVKRISQVMSNREYEIIVVDDNSPDGTEKVAKDLSKEYPVRTLVRNGKLGLASAILTGFDHARGNIIGVIDADLQHPPEYLLKFVKAIEQNDCDIAIGSRYTKGGGIEKSVIEGVKLNPTGYKLGLEILIKGNYKKVKEIPYTFKPRKNGASKLNKSEILSYLNLLKDLYLHKITRL
jgi:dolichol-phosphate mannosyltransferase